MDGDVKIKFESESSHKPSRLPQLPSRWEMSTGRIPRYGQACGARLNEMSHSQILLVACRAALKTPAGA
jgi:hypothetical protein